jgi:hypothetical protein
VLSSVETPESVALSPRLRRSTTRFLRLRTWPVRERLAPRLRPADKELFVEREGRVSWVSLPVLPDATDDAPDFILPKVDCIRDRLPRVRPGVAAPSARSGWPAHARKTVSRMPGVKSDSVCCDSDSAARRRMFFCENEACAACVEL